MMETSKTIYEQIRHISYDIPPIFFSGTLYSSSEDKANAFNDYFNQ